MWRRLMLLGVVAIGATCAHGNVPPGWTVREDTCCMEEIGSSAAADCAAREGCNYRSELRCLGISPIPEEQAAYRAREKACEIPCACICREDVEACAQRP